MAIPLPSPAPPKAASVEETFSLVSGNNPLAFAMIIRLAPDLVEEIKRLEAQGGKARMKFDANPNNPSGNVCEGYFFWLKFGFFWWGFVVEVKVLVFFW